MKRSLRGGVQVRRVGFPRGKLIRRRTTRRFLCSIRDDASRFVKGGPSELTIRGEGQFHRLRLIVGIHSGEVDAKVEIVALRLTRACE